MVKLLRENGWVVDRISGSHHIMFKAGKRAVPVPVHGKKDLPRGLVAAILRQTEIKR